jgi:hypothetical protein
MATLATQEQIAQFTSWLQDWSSSVLGPGYNVHHRYFGYELPYRREIRSQEPRWRWTLALNNKDILQLCALPEPMQRELLCARATDLLQS